jgi:hypothetical protein
MGRPAVRVLLVIAAVVVTWASVANVFLDNADVRALAEKAGCGVTADAKSPEGKTPCAMTQMDRTPIAQSFEFVTKGGVSVHVHCVRSAFLVGEYACTKE